MSLSPTGSIASNGSTQSVNLASADDLVLAEGGTVSPRFDRYRQNSDLILRASDGVHFMVHKARLTGSSVFEDMFEIGAGSEQDEAIPIVALSEDGATLELVLPFFYNEYPDVDAMPFQDVLNALEAALKYGMNLAEHVYTARMRRMLPTLRVEQAFLLWSRCSALDKADLAAEALRLTTKGSIMRFPTRDIEVLDARSVDRLWRTHMTKVQQQADLLFTHAWRQAQGDCHYFNLKSHREHMRALLDAKFAGMPCDAEEPVGFRSCERCSRLARDLDISAVQV